MAWNEGCWVAGGGSQRRGLCGLVWLGGPSGSSQGHTSLPCPTGGQVWGTESQLESSSLLPCSFLLEVAEALTGQGFSYFPNTPSPAPERPWESEERCPYRTLREPRWARGFPGVFGFA